MNISKICFVCKIYDERKYRESIKYIKSLNIPDGFAVEFFKVEQAENPTIVFNQVTRSSDAKYKVYIEDSSFVIDKDFLNNLLDIFNSDSTIGMIGALGSKDFPSSLNWIESNHKVGNVYTGRNGQIEHVTYCSNTNLFEETAFLDSSFLATQYDIPFSEEFVNYDLTQSARYRTSGYKIGVMVKDKPYLIVDRKLSKEFNSNIPIIPDLIKQIPVENRSHLPLVSILIPTYNRPDFFELALKSVLNQTYENIEIIIGDDSTNNLTEALVKENYLPYYNNIRYFKNETNLGQFENDLKLMELAKGEYINFLMDDDLFHPEKIEKMMRYYLIDENEEITLVTSHRRFINENGDLFKEEGVTQKVFKEDTVMDGKEFGNMLLKFNFNFIGEPTTVLFRKKDLQEPFGTFAGRKYGCNVDSATWLSLLKRGKGVYLNETLSFFRIHNNQQLQSDEMVVKGAIDYIESVVTSKRYGFLEGEEDYKLALENGYNYGLKIMDKIQTSHVVMDILRDLELSLEKLKVETEKVNNRINLNITNNPLHLGRKTLLNNSHNNNEVLRVNTDLAKLFIDFSLCNSGELSFEEQIQYLKMAATTSWLAHPGFFTSPILENKLHELSLQLREDIHVDSLFNLSVPLKGKEHHVHILTTAYTTGGHTKLVERWIKNRFDYGEVHSIFLIHQGNHKFPKSLEEITMSTGGMLYVFPNALSLEQRAVLLRNMVKNIADKVFLHIHPNDPIPLLAFSNYDGPSIIYFNHADHVFWLGSSISDIVMDGRENGRKITLSRRGVNNSEIVPIALEEKKLMDKEDYRKKYGIPADLTILVTIAEDYKLQPYKHLNFCEVMLEILKKSKNTVLLVVGANPSNDIWKKAKEQSGGKVVIIGPTPDIDDYYGIADIFIESFPLGSPTAALDASILGIPVVRAPMPFANILSIDLYEGMNENAKDLLEYSNYVLELIKNQKLRTIKGDIQKGAVSKRHLQNGWNYSLDQFLKQVPNKHKTNILSSNIGNPGIYDKVWAEMQFINGNRDTLFTIINQNLNI